MSNDVSYETAWKDLKMYIEILSGMSLRFAESEDMNVDERLRVEGGGIMGRGILDLMDYVEKEMTTVGEDDDQQAQD